ncbi:Fic family protein [Paenibacillus kobensis]|uniref:Fic family protein n=1 Tax=Paenibacillus kobensis TaxID=59841 RepID=UPI000FD8C456|nr:Fic family protein [Paenibacillus kobensis]
MSDETYDILDKFVNESYLTKQSFIYKQKVGSTVMRDWERIIRKRKDISIEINLLDQNKEKIWFVLTPQLMAQLHKLEEGASNDIQDIISYVTDWDNKVTELLIDEAYNSSVIEGAISTRKRTAEMLKKKEPPRDNSERMIYNNYAAMMYILDYINDQNNVINEDSFIALHKIITEGTLDEEDVTDKYRDDYVQVKDMSTNRVIYTAPRPEDVQWMMNDLFKFISDKSEFHPIIKALIVHFYIVYVHPFFDGNGRTARAFTVMYLLKEGYNFFKYLSISTAINKKKSKYYKAIEDCEQNPTDVTYFLMNQLELLLVRYFELITELKQEVGKRIINTWLDKHHYVLSKRQFKEVEYLSKKSNNLVTIAEYKKRHKVSYETARSDLLELEVIGMFDKSKVSRKYVYTFNFTQFVSKVLEELQT